LFNTGTLALRLVTGLPVTISLEEFLQTQGILRFVQHIENELSDFLGRVDKSFAPVAEQPTMLLSGGGADIPFIKALLKRRWIIAGQEVSFRSAKAIPDEILEYDADFRREYPQLAVAMGGSMEAIDEKAALDVFGGTTEKFGPLSKYAVTGV
jgi:molecular chaperone HscA